MQVVMLLGLWVCQGIIFRHLRFGDKNLTLAVIKRAHESMCRVFVQSGERADILALSFWPCSSFFSQAVGRGHVGRARSGADGGLRAIAAGRSGCPGVGGRRQSVCASSQEGTRFRLTLLCVRYHLVYVASFHVNQNVA